MITKYKKIHWTGHSKIKIRQYGLSKSKLLNIIYRPERKERGIAGGTIAVMATNKKYSFSKIKALAKTPNRPAGEIWLMYKDVKDLRKIISAWRYPGISKPGENIPIPDDIKREIFGKI